MTTKECKKCGKKKDVGQFPTDNSAKDKLWRFCRYCEYVRKHKDNPMTEKEWLAKKTAPKAKKVRSTKASLVKLKPKKGAKVETIKALQKRINDMSPKSTGIHIKNVTPEIKLWAEKEGYGWEDDHVLYVGAKAT